MYPFDEEKLTPEEIKAVNEKIANFVVKNKMEGMFIAMVATVKPYASLGSQLFMGFVEPIVESMIDPEYTAKFLSLIQNPDNIEALLRRVEELSDIREKESKKKRESETKNNESASFFKRLKRKLFK